MKVLMFGWEFPPHISGGLGTACHGLTKEMAKLDVDITFVLPRMNGDYSSSPVKVLGPQSVVTEMRQDEKSREFSHLAKHYRVDSVLQPYMDAQSYSEYLRELEQLKKREEADTFVDKTKNSDLEIIDNYGGDLFTEVGRYALVGKYLARKEVFDIIHAHDWMTYQAGIEAKKESGKPLVIHVHATEFDRTGENYNSEIYCIEKYGMEMADRIIAVSQRTKNIIVHKYNINPDKVTVVYNGVEKDALAPINRIIQNNFKKDKIVLFLGRITMQKGPEYFIEAAHRVIKKMKDVRFVMAGSGDLTKKMIEQMAKLRMTDRFHFTGFLKAPERECLFAMSDLYVMPSVSEPFGITPLEAMKHDIPIIISKQSGIGEILDHVIKVDFWDVDKLSESIVNVLTNDHLNKSMRENNQRRLREISWETAAADVREAYRHLLGW